MRSLGTAARLAVTPGAGVRQLSASSSDSSPVAASYARNSPGAEANYLKVLDRHVYPLPQGMEIDVVLVT